MESINYSNVPAQAPAAVTPIGVRIISWIMLFFGALLLLSAIIIMIRPSLPALGVGLLALIRALMLLVVAYGLRTMKRWALYVYTLFAALGIMETMYGLVSGAGLPVVSAIDTGIGLVILAYFWSMRSRWV